MTEPNIENNLQIKFQEAKKFASYHLKQYKIKQKRVKQKERIRKQELLDHWDQTEAKPVKIEKGNELKRREILERLKKR